MSGGSFDYKCFPIAQFAEELQEKIEKNNVPDETGHAYDYSPSVISMLTECQYVIELAGTLAHHVEWLYSGDYGPETFLQKVVDAFRNHLSEDLKHD